MTSAVSSISRSTNLLSVAHSVGLKKLAKNSLSSKSHLTPQREQAIRRFAEAGNNPIVMAGFSWATPLSEAAGDYPDTKFVLIDMVVDAPNVRSVVFNEHEGSYLVGMMAAQASESDVVSFVGGMDIPTDPQVRLWLRPRCYGCEP